LLIFAFSKSVKFFVPWMMEQTRSKPMPVSTCLAGSGAKVPSGLALYWMKTLFQISMQLASLPFTSLARAGGLRRVRWGRG
jgi:hypothetical protein